MDTDTTNPKLLWKIRLLAVIHKWAATWQNQQNECAPSEDSDQPGHPPSLNRVFAVRMKKAWVLSYPLSAQRRPWSESSLVAQPHCWFCHVGDQIVHGDDHQFAMQSNCTIFLSVIMMKNTAGTSWLLLTLLILYKCFAYKYSNFGL